MSAEAKTLNTLVENIRACELCTEYLPLGPRPIIQLSNKASILIIGQAPGTKVHSSGVPWEDASGDRLRDWLGITKADFYGAQVAIMPMGFCYPGRGKSGDLPPRPECQPAWHSQVLDQLPNVNLTLLIGAYAQSAYLPSPEKTLTATVQNFRAYLPQYLPLPHPSPRNNIWLKKNAWFEAQVLPTLRERIQFA